MSTKSRKDVTQAHIARHAGVTQSTVSLVLNARGGASRVSPETTARVMRAVKELNYQPKSGTWAMPRTSSGVVGIIARHNTEYLYSLPSLAIEQELGRRGFMPVVGHIDGTVEDVEKYLREFAYRGVEGVLCLTPAIWDQPRLLKMWKATLPKTVFYTSDRLPEACIVDVDRSSAVRLAVCHLAEQGHHRIGLATWGREKLEFRFSVLARMRGYRQGLEMSGLPYDEQLILNCVQHAVFGIPMQETINDLIELFLVRQKVSAVIVHNDYWAMRLVNELQSRGCRVPHDLAVVGLGNDPLGALMKPAITTVDLRHEAIAVPMVNLLERVIAEEDIPAEERLVLVEPQVVVRESA